MFAIVSWRCIAGVVPFVPGRRPTDEDARRGLSVDELTLIHDLIEGATPFEVAAALEGLDRAERISARLADDDGTRYTLDEVDERVGFTHDEIEAETTALLSDPNAIRELAEAQRAVEAGDYITGDELRARYSAACAELTEPLDLDKSRRRPIVLADLADAPLDPDRCR